MNAIAAALGVSPDELQQPAPDLLALVAIAFGMEPDELRNGTTGRARSLRSTLLEVKKAFDAYDAEPGDTAAKERAANRVEVLSNE